MTINVFLSFIPSDKESSPVPGVTSFSNPDTTLVFTSVGQTYNVGFGKEVNLVYEGGINPDDTYLVYESTLDGYTLQLKNRTDEVEVKLERLCQYYIVASPNFTTIKVNPSLKYEQIIWTPRPDGTWEVRIGATERGCKSKALQELQKVRTKDYEKGLPKK